MYKAIAMNPVHRQVARTVGVVKMLIGMIGSRAHRNSVIMKSAIKMPEARRKAMNGSSLFVYMRNKVNDETSVIEPP